MSNIGDDWSDQQHEPTEDVDFDASGTTPPRPVKWDDTEAGPPPEPVQHQPPPSDHSGSNQQSNQQTSQQTPNDNSQGNIVHVSHMHVGVDDQLLTEHMSSSGKVIRVVIMLDPHTKESRGFGFVTFESASDADDAIEKLHLSQILGKTITVARARRGRPRDPTPGHYIGPPKCALRAALYLSQLTPMTDDRSMSSNGRPSKPRYQPYPSRDMGDSRDMRDARDARDYGYDRYERGPPRYAGRYHPYPDRDDRYGWVTSTLF
ncbi:hypothetical protein E3P99_00109 [Wallemia hederae]|uniref:RRM domain-containing protein n=1 Tax=Wallemia hederae TaxID=1540922 RepID=A0A4T0FYT9_9BASI|nr:hypothetical protein E3P99_00109 [Wallemia hederae]